jgi:hypothetical protein
MGETKSHQANRLRHMNLLPSTGPLWYVHPFVSIIIRLSRCVSNKRFLLLDVHLGKGEVKGEHSSI